MRQHGALLNQLAIPYSVQLEEDDPNTLCWSLDGKFKDKWCFESNTVTCRYDPRNGKIDERLKATPSHQSSFRCTHCLRPSLSRLRLLFKLRNWTSSKTPEICTLCSQGLPPGSASVTCAICNLRTHHPDDRPLTCPITHDHINLSAGLQQSSKIDSICPLCISYIITQSALDYIATDTPVPIPVSRNAQPNQQAEQSLTDMELSTKNHLSFLSPITQSVGSGSRAGTVRDWDDSVSGGHYSKHSSSMDMEVCTQPQVLSPFLITQSVTPGSPGTIRSAALPASPDSQSSSEAMEVSTQPQVLFPSLIMQTAVSGSYILPIPQSITSGSLDTELSMTRQSSTAVDETSTHTQPQLLFPLMGATQLAVFGSQHNDFSTQSHSQQEEMNSHDTTSQFPLSQQSEVSYASSVITGNKRRRTYH